MHCLLHCAVCWARLTNSISSLAILLFGLLAWCFLFQKSVIKLSIWGENKKEAYRIDWPSLGHVTIPELLTPPRSHVMPPKENQGGEPRGDPWGMDAGTVNPRDIHWSLPQLRASYWLWVHHWWCSILWKLSIYTFTCSTQPSNSSEESSLLAWGPSSWWSPGYSMTYIHNCRERWLAKATAAAATSPQVSAHHCCCRALGCHTSSLWFHLCLQTKNLYKWQGECPHSTYYVSNHSSRCLRNISSLKTDKTMKYSQF